MISGLLNSVISSNLEWPLKSLTDCKSFKMHFFVQLRSCWWRDRKRRAVPVHKLSLLLRHDVDSNNTFCSRPFVFTDCQTVHHSRAELAWNRQCLNVERLISFSDAIVSCFWYLYTVTYSMKATTEWLDDCWFLFFCTSLSVYLYFSHLINVYDGVHL